MAISKNEPSVYVRSQLKVDASLIDNEPMVTNEELRSAFAERLNKAIKESGRPLRGAAVRMHELTGKSTNAAGKWLKGESMPTPANMQLLCDWLGVRAEWLQYGIGPMHEHVGSAEPRASYGIAEGSNVQEVAPPIQSRRYPIISRVQAGAWTECVAPYEPGDEPQEEVTDYRAQGKAFWLEVKGDSMTAPAGSRPSVPEGTLVLFDTGIDAVPGKLVAALLADSNEATFKQLIEDSGQRYLKALNPAYPLIPINGNCRILGVAVEAKTKF